MNANKLTSTPGSPGRVADPSDSPSNADILNYLKVMATKISAIDKRLESLSILERKVAGFETEMKKLHTIVNDKMKHYNEKSMKVCDRVDNLEMSVGMAGDEITQLRKAQSNIQDTLLYLQSQSMRSNLVFTNIKESINERHEDCEVKVRQFIVEKHGVAQDLVDSIQFERVHRIGVSGSTSGAESTTLRPRNIVTKFSLYKDKKMVRRAKSKLRGTDHYIFEQFPKEIADHLSPRCARISVTVRGRG